jgi:hypothetical protein
MSEIGSTEALEKYLTLERQNKMLLDDNRIYKCELEKMREAYSKVSGQVNTLFNWLETREDTKTKTIQRKMAELFKWAYMESIFPDLKAKWPINQKSVSQSPCTTEEVTPK